MNCDFCAELSAVDGTRFESVYSGLLDSRIALRSEAFAALPTLGQLFEGSYLIVPTAHIEQFAVLSLPQRQKALEFIAAIEQRLKRYGQTVVFEHGASCADGTGCGVYHAHVHVVPVPRETSCNELIGGPGPSQPSVLDAWEAVAGAREYLLVRDTYGQVSLSFHAPGGKPFVSQFMRKRLVDVFRLDCPWDWRAYQAPEARLLRSVRAVLPCN